MPLKKDKKSRLKGAAAGELGKSGIMRDFIENVNSDKNNGGNDSKGREAGSRTENAKKDYTKPAASKGDFPGKNRPVPYSSKTPHSTTAKEWWLSFSSFFLIIGLIFGIYFFSALPETGSYVMLSNSPISDQNISAHSSPPSLSRGNPVYFTYTSDKPVGSDTLGIAVYQYGPSNEKTLLTALRVNVKPHWRVISSHFQKEYFEYPGKYEMVMETATRVELTRQVFHIR